jgi:hypothetical protein
MYVRIPFRSSRIRSTISLLAGLLLAGPTSALALVEDPPEAPATEPALTRTADDARLQWGPCPPFLPEGCALAVLHGDPAKGNADVFLRLPGGSDVPLHWHTSAERMVLVAGELHATYEGQETAVMRPGTYGYGPAKRPHHARCASAEPCVLFIAFEEPVDAVPSVPR